MCQWLSGNTNDERPMKNDKNQITRTNITLIANPLAGENREMTFWPFNTEGVALRTQRPLREQLQFLYF
jgi:hypothetical protein